MIRKTRNCMVLKHEQFPCSHICTHQDCDFECRWVCVECIKNNTHQHGQKTQNHLLGQEDFKSYFKQIDFKQLQEQENMISQYLQSLHKIREQINELDCYLQLCLKESGNDISRDLQHLIDNKFFLINNQQISQIVKLNQNPNLIFDQDKVDESMIQLILLSQQLLSANFEQQQMVQYQNYLNSQLQYNQKIKIIQQQRKQLNQQDQQASKVQQVQQVQQQVQQGQQQQVKQQPLFAQVAKKPQHKLTYKEFKWFNKINEFMMLKYQQMKNIQPMEEKTIYQSFIIQNSKFQMKWFSIIQLEFVVLVEILLYYMLQNGNFHCIQFEANMSHRYLEKLHKDDIWSIYQLENDQVLSSSNEKIIISDKINENNISIGCS